MINHIQNGKQIRIIVHINYIIFKKNLYNVDICLTKIHSFNCTRQYIGNSFL